MQQEGRVIPGSDLLALRPIESDLEGLIGRVDLDFDARKLGLFNASTFDAAVDSDIANAKESIVIFSGFVTPGRVGKLGDRLRVKVAQGIKVRCITRPPHLNGAMQPALGREALDLLEGIGCTVDCRVRIHEKVVLIDKSTVWYGSLNALSHAHRTDESMTRLVNAGFAQALAANMSKLRVSSAKALAAAADPENPRCGDCGHRTFYDEGTFGPFFRCEDRCGWSVSLKTIERYGRVPPMDRDGNELPTEGPSCPLCGNRTQLRTGRFGPFYRCIETPTCSGTCPPPGARRRGTGKHPSDHKQSGTHAK